MLPSLLIWASLAVAALGLRTPEGCTIGETWTDNFIRFQCFKGAGMVVKEVRPIGCVPTNSETGDLIDAEQTYHDEKFTYKCNIQQQESGAVATYTIISCLDTKGELLAIGESRIMEDGRELKCFKDESGAVKLAQEKDGGCVFDGKVVKDGKTWKRPVDFKATVNGVEKIIGKAESMKCVSDGKGGFVPRAYGCVTATGVWVQNKGFSKVHDDFVQCLIDSNGTVTMKIVDPNVVSCDWKGTEVKSGESKTIDENVIYCKYGKFEKTGCMVGEKFIKKGLAYVDGKAYHCWDSAGLFHFENLTGCTLPDGSIKPFHSIWQNGTEFHQCHYVIKKDQVTTSVKVFACAFQIGSNWKAIKAGKIGINGKEIKICALDGTSWKMRELTKEELENLKKKGVDIFEGEEGKGEGRVQDITGQCLNLMDACKKIDPICQAPTDDQSVVELIEIMDRLNVTISEIRSILEKADPSKANENADKGAPKIDA